MNDIFLRAKMLFGKKAMEKLKNSSVIVFGLGGSCDVSEIDILVVGILVQEPSLDLAIVARHLLVELLDFIELCDSNFVLDVSLDVVGHPLKGQATVGFLVSGDDCGTHRDGEVREVLVEFCQFTELCGGGVLGTLGESLGQGDGVLGEVDGVGSSLFHSSFSFHCAGGALIFLLFF